jgi:hypothetical protein
MSLLPEMVIIEKNNNEYSKNAAGILSLSHFMYSISVRIILHPGQICYVFFAHGPLTSKCLIGQGEHLIKYIDKNY